MRAGPAAPTLGQSTPPRKEPSMSVAQPEPSIQVSVSPEAMQAGPGPLRLAPPAPAPVLVPGGDASTAVAEERRWLRWLVLPFVLGAALFAAAVASGVV